MPPKKHDTRETREIIRRKPRAEINKYDQVHNNPKCSRADKEIYASAVRDFLED